jgi:hypothetical protein
MSTVAEMRLELADLERQLAPARRSAHSLARQSPQAALISADRVRLLEFKRDRLRCEIAIAETGAA